MCSPRIEARRGGSRFADSGSRCPTYIRREALADVGNARGEVFLNAAIASASCLYARGRALRCEKPSLCRARGFQPRFRGWKPQHRGPSSPAPCRAQLPHGARWQPEFPLSGRKSGWSGRAPSGFNRLHPVRRARDQLNIRAYPFRPREQLNANLPMNPGTSPIWKR